MQPTTSDGRPLPLITPVAEPHFDAARQGRLELQKCPRDGFFFYPRTHCSRCLGDDWQWAAARPRGRIHAFTIDRLGAAPGLRQFAPFAIALVDLEDGPRVPGTVVDIPFDQLRTDLPVRVDFHIVDDMPLMIFRPLDESR